MNFGLEELYFLHHLSYIYKVACSFSSSAVIPEQSFHLVLFVQRFQLQKQKPSVNSEHESQV